jgi:hypothetical protein
MSLHQFYFKQVGFMSKRENIANDIITKLDAVTSPIEFKKLTREPFEVEELADAQFPAAFIQAGDETREPASIGATGSGTYMRNNRFSYCCIW